jgi:hypothetical protein
VKTNPVDCLSAIDDYVADMKAQLTPQEIADWAYEQSRHFKKMGDQITATFNLRVPKENGAQTDTAAAPTAVNGSAGARTPVIHKTLLFRIQEALMGKKCRAADLADALGVTRPEIEVEISRNAQLFERAKQGWIGLSKDFQQPQASGASLEEY